MAFDGITVAAIAAELKKEILGGRINKIAQPESDELLITIKTPDGQKKLSVSASASLPLIYLTKESKASPMTAPNFCMLLRKHIGNGRITAIHQPSLERILCFEIEHLNDLGDLCKKKLIVELMGKHSNIIFCNEDNLILDSIKHVSAQMSSVREVLPGRDYFIPDTMSKKDPLCVDEQAFLSLLKEKAMPLFKAIYTSFTGISPTIAQALCYQSGIDSSLPASELEEDFLLHLFRQFHFLIEEVKEGAFSPVLYQKDGIPKEFSAISLRQFESDPAYETLSFASISELLIHYYDSKSKLTRIRQKSVDLRQVVQTALERNVKKYDLQCRQMKDTENREKFRIYGELINTYGYNLEPKAKSLTCLNYYSNEEITIPLDPQLSPQENAQKYFARYNKQKRTYEALSSLLSQTHEEVEYLDSISNALNIALSESDLAQIKEELMQSGYIKRKFTKKKVKLTSKPLHYLSSDGFHIYVGKNNLQNEELTFHFANGGDWWFHAKKTPGSHVIVKSEGKELPDRTFEEAGRLAGYYSKKQGADKVEIDYVERKHVKKPNGSKPGFVVYYTNYSLMIDTDISGISLIED